MRSSIVGCVLSAVLVMPAVGETYVVHPDGTGDFPTIQAAIDAVIDGDTVELSDGVFLGDGNRDIIWEAKSITLRSQSGNPENCIIDCDGTLRRNHWGFYIADVGPEALLEGVTVRNGFASLGAAIGMLDSSPRIERCMLLDNTAGDGSLLLNGASFPRITGCTFAGNRALFTGGGLCI
jgi:hypothetical protein